jgi:prepilin-type N-terminal cleavage/methylation domain-containing protein
MNTCHDQRGFTLWELLMTLLVAGIMLGVGVPNVMEFQRNSGMVTAANDLVTELLAARSEAVKRQVPVTICMTDDPMAADPVCELDPIADSTRGFVVFVDENGNVDANNLPILTDASDGNAAFDAGETVLRRLVTPGGSIRLSTNCGYVAFGPTGAPRRAGGPCLPFEDTPGTPWMTFLFCDDRGRRVAGGGLSSARIVRVDRFGRGQVLTEVAGANGIGVTNTIVNTLVAGGVNPTCP